MFTLLILHLIIFTDYECAGFRDEYFNNLENTTEEVEEDDKSFLHKYESILSSKINEETMVNTDNYIHVFSHNVFLFSEN